MGRTRSNLQRSMKDHPRRCPNADWIHRQDTHPLVSWHRGSRGWCDTHAPRHGRSRDRRSKALLLTTRRLASPVPEDAHFVGTPTPNLYWTVTLHPHDGSPRRPAGDAAPALGMASRTSPSVRSSVTPKRYRLPPDCPVCLPTQPPWRWWHFFSSADVVIRG